MFCQLNEIQAIFFIFNTNPRFPPFLLYLRCKSGVTFIQRSFRDEPTKCLLRFEKKLLAVHKNTVSAKREYVESYALNECTLSILMLLISVFNFILKRFMFYRLNTHTYFSVIKIAKLIYFNTNRKYFYCLFQLFPFERHSFANCAERLTRY